MPKASAELTEARREEIVDACEQLYQTMPFREITIKHIGSVISVTRTSIYNYFQTKEEIFLALLRREYLRWGDSLCGLLEGELHMTREQFADALARTLEERPNLLKLRSMNLYEMEENSRLEHLTVFKQAYARSFGLVEQCVAVFFPDMSEERRQRFTELFFPMIYGIYPYTHATEKQAQAMEQAGFVNRQLPVYELAYRAILKLL